MTKSDTDHAVFLVVLILLGSLFTHKAGMIQAEHITMYIILSVGVLVIVVALVRATRGFRLKASGRDAYINTMTGLEFEHYVAKLLIKRGFSNVRLTEEYDYGVDIIAQKDGLTWGIQVKRYSGLVGADAVRQVVTALKFYNCDRAMVITNSVFSRPAIVLADVNDCLLLDKASLSLPKR